MSHDRPVAATAAIPAARDEFMRPEFVPDLVSVIIPTYNRKKMVLEALDSVVAQTYRPIEMLVVDDGSIDGTSEAVTEWYANLALSHRTGLDLKIRQQRNSGAQRARNLGLWESRGEFIQFLDSDDLLHKDKLSAQVSHLKRAPDVSYVYSSLEISSGGSALSGKRRRVSAQSATVAGHLARGLQTGVGIYRRQACLRIGPWNEELEFSQDHEYNLRLIFLREKIYFLDQTYMIQRRHRDHRKIWYEALVDVWSHIEKLVDQHGTREERLAAARWLGLRYTRTALAAASTGNWQLACRCCESSQRMANSWPDRIKAITVTLVCRSRSPQRLKSMLAHAILASAKYRRIGVWRKWRA